MKKNVTVEFNRNGPAMGQHGDAKAPVRVFIALEADTIEHAQVDLQSSLDEVLSQFDRHTARQHTTPSSATAGPALVHRAAPRPVRDDPQT